MPPTLNEKRRRQVYFQICNMKDKFNESVARMLPGAPTLDGSSDKLGVRWANEREAAALERRSVSGDAVRAAARRRVAGLAVGVARGRSACDPRRVWEDSQQRYSIVLGSFDLTAEVVRDRVLAMGGCGTPRGDAEDIRVAPRSRKVLELALREAIVLGFSAAGTEHILLALIREHECVAAGILRALVPDADREIRNAVIRTLSDTQPHMLRTQPVPSKPPHETSHGSSAPTVRPQQPVYGTG
jgi:hypothetical protein